MFERFTEPARRVVVFAQEEARVLNHDYIGTEHILLGLLRAEDGLGASVLNDLGVTLDQARSQVVRIVGTGEEVTSGQIPFTPRAKRVLERSLREALSLGHNYIGPEHLLLALVRDSDGVAARIMLDLDADGEKVRNTVIRSLSGKTGPRSTGEQHGDVGADAPTSIALNDRARLAIELAKREALSLGKQEVGTEHLLLGLQLSGEGLAARILEHLGVTIERARPLIATISGAAEPRPFGEIPLTPAARNAIAGAAQEALNLGAESIGTEHILLSLTFHYEGVLGRVLLDLGATPQQIREQTLRMSPPARARNLARTVSFHTARPSLDWRRATLLWRPEGVELRVPLRLGVAAMAAFAADAVWSGEPLAGLRREIWTGWLALASPTLLQDIDDPQALKRSLNDAVQRALDSGERDGAAASEFLNRLRDEHPD